MKKIVFGITSLTIGGSERVLVDIVNKLKGEYDITILSIYSGGDFAKEVSDKVKIVNIFSKPRSEYSLIIRLLISILFFFYITRKIIYSKYIKNKYDLEIAFLEGPITSLFSVSPMKNNIAWIHNDINLVFGNGFKAKIKKLKNKNIYKKFSKLIFVSVDNKNNFEKTYDVNVEKKVIYNYLDIDRVKSMADKDESVDIKNDFKSFLVVARLTEQKGIKRLLDVHKKLIDDGYKHYIYIIGDGPLKDDLTNAIKQCKLEETFILLGKKINPYPYMKMVDVATLPSLYEGYGMVLVEAKILGKYILITDTAAREAIINYNNSMIVPNNEEGIYNGIKNILENNYNIENSVLYENKDIINDIIEVIES